MFERCYEDIARLTMSVLSVGIIFIIIFFSPDSAHAQRLLNKWYSYPQIIIITILILDNIFTTPNTANSIVNGSATFFCSVSPLSTAKIVSTQWFINDTLLEELEVDNIEIPVQDAILFSPVSLSQNNTRVKCMANLSVGVIRTSSNSFLRIQGIQA